MYKTVNQDTNIFQLLKQLWDGKWIIIIFIVFSMLLASIYVDFRKNKYRFSTTYIINVFPVDMGYRDENIYSYNRRIGDRVRFLLNLLPDSHWVKVKNQSTLIITSNDLNDLKRYKQELKKIQEIFTKEIYKKATFYVKYLQNESFKEETRMIFKLRSQEIINRIDNDEKFITFSPISYKRISALPSIIFISFMLLGLATSIIIIIVRNSFLFHNKIIDHTK